MLGIILRNRIRNKEIRRRTEYRDERWTLKTVQWPRRETKKNVDRLLLRWLDDIRGIAGRDSKHKSQDSTWRSLGKRWK